MMSRRPSPSRLKPSTVSMMARPGATTSHTYVMSSAATGRRTFFADPGVNNLLTVEQLMEFCKENFTGYKKPKYIEFRDELPKSNVGKILRRELRDAAVAAAHARSA